jgi:hypothetical protein
VSMWVVGTKSGTTSFIIPASPASVLTRD